MRRINRALSSLLFFSFHRQFSGKKIAKPTPPPSAKNNSAKSRNSAKVKVASKAPQQAECRMDNAVLHAVPLSKQNVKSQMPPRRDGLTTPVVFMVTLSGDSKVKVHIPSETEPRSPTLSECNAIIKQQQETNYKQAQEVICIKLQEFYRLFILFIKKVQVCDLQLHNFEF